MLPRGPAVELIDPDLLAAQVVWVPRVVLDVNPKVSIALLGLLGEREGRRQAVRGIPSAQVPGLVQGAGWMTPQLGSGERTFYKSGLGPGRFYTGLHLQADKWVAICVNELVP